MSRGLISNDDLVDGSKDPWIQELDASPRDSEVMSRRGSRGESITAPVERELVGQLLNRLTCRVKRDNVYDALKKRNPIFREVEIFRLEVEQLPRDVYPVEDFSPP